MKYKTKCDKPGKVLTIVVQVFIRWPKVENIF
jgi:hypothetical protein